MSYSPTATPEDFALEVVQRLQSKGHVAYWVGGCVRDRLLERTVKDYDVATDATPDRIREIFGRRRTQGVGAAFGVILVHGPKTAGPIEVATFREDAHYSDGRHPDSVTFSSPEKDARRRDFTINGLFYDPSTDQLIDYVGGQQDLSDKLIRAIGEADQRIDEDKLRMLRAVRFAATFGFRIDDDTKAAIARRPSDILLVSAERIGDELRRMLSGAGRRSALSLLVATGLLNRLLPEFEAECDLGKCQLVLSNLSLPSFPPTLASMLVAISHHRDGLAKIVDDVSQRWRLTNDEARETLRLVNNERQLRRADSLPWSTVQPILSGPAAADIVAFAAAMAASQDESLTGIEFCGKKLELPTAELDPAPLLTGEDLIGLEIPPGPIFKSILQVIRDRQLDGECSTVEEAVVVARAIAQI